MDKLLHVVEGEGAEEDETSVEPDVEEGLAWPEHLHDRDAHHACTAHAKHASPLKELL